MPAQTTKTYKGDVNQDFSIDPTTMTSEVRSQLETAGFIGPDNTAEAWRFFIYKAKTTNFADAILSKDVESLVPVGGMLGAGNQLYLTNINAGTNPDLMGIGATWFFDRYMSCQVSLNNSDATAQQKNSGKFQPYMLTNVKPTSRNVAGIYDNVVVCEKGSSIAFSVNSWGAAGFGYSVKPSAGDSIVDGLYITFGNNPNTEASGYIYRYQNQAQQIVVDSTQDLEIPSGKTVQYQRVTIKTWRVTSYQQGGNTYTSNAQPPGLKAPAAKMDSLTDFGKADFAALADDGVSPHDLAKAAVIPGNTITPGAPHQGDNSGQTFGTIYDLQEDDRNANPLGEIVLYFFVFKSHEDARLVIDQINTPDPSVWS